MLKQQDLLFHIGITLFETLLSFLLVIFFTLLITILLWRMQKAAKILEPYLVVLNSLPKSALAPAFDRMARCQLQNDHFNRNVCRDLWLRIKPVYRLCPHRTQEKIKLVRQHLAETGHTSCLK